MPIKLLKNKDYIFFISFLMLLTTFAYAGTTEEAPFHLNNPIEQEMMYPYIFEEVWNASLQFLTELDKEMREKDSSTNIAIDKNLGLLTLTIIIKHSAMGAAYGGKKSFIAHNLLIKPIDKQRTKVCYHLVTYYLYNFPRDKSVMNGMMSMGILGYGLAGGAGITIPHIIFTDPTANLKGIEDKLRWKSKWQKVIN